MRAAFCPCLAQPMAYRTLDDAKAIQACAHGRVQNSKNHAPLQDGNDAYLGNLQTDGTYSVVPRILGGEITPDKLIVIGEVARKYELYTKISGGQRIDLLGIRAG